MNETQQMYMCPNCHSQVSKDAKFCSDCGMGLAPGAPDAVWFAAMQEKIKYAKANDLFYTIFSVLGAVVAIAILFIMRFVLKRNMDIVSWELAGAGILFFIGGYFGTWYNGRKAKELIRQLEKGQK